MVTDEPDRNTDLLNELPVVYSIALRLRTVGLPAVTVADCLGIDVAALPMLYAVAEAKLAHLRERR